MYTESQGSFPLMPRAAVERKKKPPRVPYLDRISTSHGSFCPGPDKVYFGFFSGSSRGKSYWLLAEAALALKTTPRRDTSRDFCRIFVVSIGRERCLIRACSVSFTSIELFHWLSGRPACRFSCGPVPLVPDLWQSARGLVFRGTNLGSIIN